MATVLMNGQKLRSEIEDSKYLEKLFRKKSVILCSNINLNLLEISLKLASVHFYSIILATNLLYLATLVLKLSLFLEKRVDEVHRFRR